MIRSVRRRISPTVQKEPGIIHGPFPMLQGQPSAGVRVERAPKHPEKPPEYYPRASPVRPARRRPARLLRVPEPTFRKRCFRHVTHVAP